MTSAPTTTAQRRQRLHDLVAERMDAGESRTVAMNSVAAAEQLRAGHVAASYYRIAREQSRQTRSPQMAQSTATAAIALEAITSNGNARTAPIDEGEDFDALVASIRERGVLVPVLVTREAEEGKPFQLVDGHRRLAAARAAGLVEIPARVVEASGPADASVLAMVANVRRLNLSPIEEADAYVRILEAKGWTQKRLAASLGVSADKVASRVKLARLPQGVRDQVAAGAVPLSALPTIEKVAAVAPALAEALVTEEAIVDFGEVRTPEDAADALGWLERRRSTESRGGPSAVPFLYGVGGYGSSERNLDGFGLSAGAYPELAAAWAKAVAGDEWPRITLVENPDDLIDQARAYGCLVEVGGQFFITDEAWMADRVKAAVAAHKPPKRATRGSAAGTATTPEAEKEAKAAEREKERVERLAAGARNRELEQILRTALSRPERIEPAIARLIAASALEDLSPGRVALVFAELHTVTSTGKDEKRREKTVTVKAEEAEAWAREWVLGCESATDILGRAAAVLLAHHLADDHVMPQSGRPYHHDHGEPVRRVLDATPIEVDAALVASFKERKSYQLGDDEAENDPPDVEQ